MGVNVTYITRQKLIILKNVLAICISFVFCFTALSSITNLQSSLNSEASLGTTSLSVVYVGLILSCLFLPSAMIGALGCKWTVTISMLGYVIYTVVNVWPSWYTLVPASLLLGFSAAPLWSAKCTYLTQVSAQYAKINNESTEVVTTRFFGIFFFFFQTCQIWGNLISSTILSPDIPLNITEPEDMVTEFCGANLCPWNAFNNTQLVRPSDSKIMTLMGVVIGSAVIGFLFILSVLDPIPNLSKKEESSAQRLLSTLRQMGNMRQFLLIPITIYSGLEQGFITSDFTKAFIACNMGIWMVGYIMIAFGISDALSSYLVGKLMEILNRQIVMLIGTAAHLGVYIVLLAWRDLPTQREIYFILAAVLGLGDAVWQTEINAIYGVMFPKNPEAAFSNYRLWESIGFTIAFGYSGFLCVSVKTYICLGVLVLGMICYLLVEFVLPPVVSQAKQIDTLSDSVEMAESKTELALANVQASND